MFFLEQESEGPESEYVDEGPQDDEVDELHSEDDGANVRPWPPVTR